MTKLALVGICAVTFLSRVLGQWSKVFVDGAVIFRGQDSWYHIRLAQVLKANFPFYMHNDYFVNPMGQPPVGWPPVLTYLIATPGLLLSERETEGWGALLPPIVAVLVVSVTYFLAKEVLHSRGYALITALLVGILPTQFFQKTLLGFTDHHMLEVLFVSLSLLLLLKRKYLFLGLTLGALFWTWTGAGYIVVVLTLGVAVEMFRRRLKGANIRELGLGFSYAVGVSGILYVLGARYSVAQIENWACIAIGGFTPLLLLLLSYLIKGRKAFAYLAPTAGLAVSLTAFFLLPLASWWGAAFNRGSAEVVSEFTPLTLPAAFSSFGITLLLFIPGIVLFAKDERNWILPMFTIPIFVSSINQIRFTYYLVIPVAIFTAYFIKWVAERVNGQTVVAGIITAFVLMASFTNIVTASTFENTMSPNMYQALAWIRNNAPEPEGDWYSLKSEAPNYQVLAWWDYGSWIAYVARRAPLTSPRGAYLPQMTEFWLDGEVGKLEKIAEKLYGEGNVDVRWLVLENQDMKADWVKYLTDETQQNRLWMFDSRKFWVAYQNDEVTVLRKTETETIPIE